MHAKIQTLKDLYDHSTFKTFCTEDYEYITQLDFENNIIYYYIYVTQSCGCCSAPEDCERDLDLFIMAMTEEDYLDLLTELGG